MPKGDRSGKGWAAFEREEGGVGGSTGRKWPRDFNLDKPQHRQPTEPKLRHHFTKLQFPASWIVVDRRSSRGSLLWT